MELSPSPVTEGRWADLPEDIALAVASRLQEADVCALGGCSRSWGRACDADCVWEGLFRRRWPATAAAVVAGGGERASGVQRWKALYINHHKRTAVAISSVVEFVERSSHNGSLEAEYYLKAIADLALNDIGFIDVQFFLFSRNHSAIINLIGLHYSIACLHILKDNAVSRWILALGDSKILTLIERMTLGDGAIFYQMKSIKQFKLVKWHKGKCVSLLKLGRWFYGFLLPDEYESHKISLSALTMSEGAEVLAVLNRGSVHEVFRLQVSLVDIDK